MMFTAFALAIAAHSAPTPPKPAAASSSDGQTIAVTAMLDLSAD